MRHVAIVAIALLVATTAHAHHSAIRFDQEQVIPIQGTVTRYEWRSPHVYIYLEDSNTIEWQLEAASPQLMYRLGWTPNSVLVGDTVSIRANPDTNLANAHGLILSLETQEGEVLSARRTGIPLDTEAETEASTSSLTGVWRGDESYVTAFLSALENHPLTEKGKTAKAEYQESMNPVVDCVAFPSPFIVAANARYLNEIDIGDEEIIFQSEFYNAERTIFTDDREHPEDGQRTNQGHSIGHWEGETLVVDTRLFSESRAPIPTVGIPSGLAKHVIERYTLNEEGTQVVVETWTEDPEYLAEPLAADFVWHYAPDLEMLRYECDPDVARRFVE